MNTKDRLRQRDAKAPRGAAPNWLVAAIAAAVAGVAFAARALF
jgi:hypothetical protein